jgi:hypothetical protein
MLLIEDDIILSSDQKRAIDFLNTPDFPWFLNFTNYEGKGIPDFYFGHITRAVDKIDDSNNGIINSEFCGPLESIFFDFASKHNISINKIHRSAVNCITYQDEEHSNIHRDHYFEHKVFIYYINKCTKGNTYIFENDKKTIVEHKMGKGFIFDGVNHAAGYPNKYECRKVFVLTFS